jgi:hypothetical protein
MLQVLNCLIQIRIRPAVSFGSESESGIRILVDNKRKKPHNNFHIVKVIKKQF